MSILSNRNKSQLHSLGRLSFLCFAKRRAFGLVFSIHILRYQAKQLDGG